MTEIILISEKFIKENSNISDNVNGKILLPAIREAQEINLRSILGDALLDSIKQAVAEGINIPKNKRFETLLLQCQYFLLYQTITNLLIITSVKIDNLGVLRASDENTEIVSFDDLYSLKGNYQAKADWYAKRIQNYVLDNLNLYPEVNNNNCFSIKSNLISAATSGLWLGGARGTNDRMNHRVERNNAGGSSDNCIKQNVDVESSNEDQIITPSEGYSCIEQVDVMGYDVDDVYNKLSNI